MTRVTMHAQGHDIPVLFQPVMTQVKTPVLQLSEGLCFAICDLKYIILPQLVVWEYMELLEKVGLGKLEIEIKGCDWLRLEIEGCDWLRLRLRTPVPL